MFAARRLRLALALVLAFALIGVMPATAQAAYIYIDPGHGGIYNHAHSYGVYEKLANLQIALELRRQLQLRGYKVGMTRTTDTAVETHDIPTWNWSDTYGWRFRLDGKRYGDPPKDDLQGRVNKANAAGADLFISIHNNGGPTSARGTETYAHADDVLGRKLAGYVQDAVVQAVGTRDRGSMQEGFYVVRWSNMPAILVECAFVSNPYDAAMLRSPWYRARFARGIANGVGRFLATDPFKAVYPRISGTDGYATSAAVSAAGWPDGADTVLVASGARSNWPDSVAAAPLSRKLDAPLLLVGSSTVPTTVAEELHRLAPRQVVVLGGEASVSETLAAEVASAAAVPTDTVRRIAGADRYETAAAIAREVGVSATGTVTLVSGTGYADALSVAGYAAKLGSPVLLSENSTLPEPTRAFLGESADASRTLLEVGASAAAVPASETSGFGARRRLWGADSYRTNVTVVRAYGTGTISPLAASIHYPAEALLASVYSAKTGRPLVLVGHRYLSPYTREFVLRNVARVGRPTFVGGTQTIPRLMEWEWLKARDGD